VLESYLWFCVSVLMCLAFVNSTTEMFSYTRNETHYLLAKVIF